VLFSSNTNLEDSCCRKTSAGSVEQMRRESLRCIIKKCIFEILFQHEDATDSTQTEKKEREKADKEINFRVSSALSANCQPVFIIGKCDTKRRHFEVNVGRRRCRRSGKRGGDGPGKRLGARQTLHVHAVDVQHVASCRLTAQRYIK